MSQNSTIKQFIFGQTHSIHKNDVLILLQISVISLKEMGKHRHSKDKMHITYTEMKEDWEGKKEVKKIPFVKLPFYCCALSLSPFIDPVCTVDGNVFEGIYIADFIKNFQRCPITGKPLRMRDLIKMNWTKNEKGEYQDPISYKVFTENTHIVCIKTSGYVYAYQTIQELNKKEKYYFDLVTNDPFTPEDIINIQDPKNDKNKQVAEFDFLKNNIPFIPPEKLQPNIKENETITRVMQEITVKRQAQEDLKKEQTEKKKKLKLELQSRQDVKGFIKWAIENKVYKHQRETDMTNSTSLTSTNFTPFTSGITSFRDLKESEIRQKIYNVVKKEKMKGNVLMVTNLGNFSILVHADLVPKTSQNFIELSENGYYNGLKFHRLVKDFCLQGGDPTQTGAGGQSIFGKPFEDEFNPKLTHNKPGILSMANAGPKTNGSQFFITLQEAPYLNNKHSVFGEIVSSESMVILYEINKNLTSKTNKPKKDIIIQKMHVYQNPFRRAIKILRDDLQKQKNKAKITQTKKEERWIENEKQKFKLPEAKEQKNQKGGSASSQILSDYF